MRRTFDKFFAVVDKIFEFLSFLTLGGMTLLITIQVICRYLLNSPLGWSEELARFGFIWMTFFAGYLGARRAQHISVELVQNLFPRQVKKGNEVCKFVDYLCIFPDGGVLFAVPVGKIGGSDLCCAEYSDELHLFWHATGQRFPRTVLLV